MEYIIATHGKLASGYVDTIKLVTQADHIYPVCAYGESEDFPENMSRLLDSFQVGEPVTVFTDLLGGSVTQKIMELWGNRPSLYVFAGVNLPLVIEMVLSGIEPSSDFIQNALALAKDQMVYVNDKMRDIANDSTSSCG